jgi:hypothetical protein
MIIQDNFQWDRGGALDQAAALGQQDLIDLINGAIEVSNDPYYDDHDDHHDLLTHVVCRGLLNAVKYLYEHGRNTIGLVEHCFITATEHAQIRIMQFFLDTDRVSMKTFDKAFALAYQYSWT